MVDDARFTLEIMRMDANTKIISAKLIPLLFIVVFGVACSARVEYETPPPGPISVCAININTATVNELEKLPYVGRKTAEAIVAFREREGPFRRPEHLMLIRGLSEKRFAELRPYLTAE